MSAVNRIEGKPAVSIVLPVYNAEAYLWQALDSLVAQTFPDFECLVIDDGSTDESARVASEFAARDARIVLHRRRHRGLVETLNEGFSMAGGKYIARMDADDLCAPNRLEKQVRFLEDNLDVDVLGTAVVTFSGLPGKGRISRAPANHAGCYAELLFRPPINHPTVMLRRSIVDSLGDLYCANWEFCEDYELWSRLIESYVFANLAEPLVYYRQHDDQVTIEHGERTKELHNEVSRGMFRRIQVDFSSEEIPKVLAWEPCDGGIEDLLQMYQKIILQYDRKSIIDPGDLARVISSQLEIALLRFYGFAGLVRCYRWSRAQVPYARIKVPWRVFPRLFALFLARQLKRPGR